MDAHPVLHTPGHIYKSTPDIAFSPSAYAHSVELGRVRNTFFASVFVTTLTRVFMCSLQIDGGSLGLLDDRTGRKVLTALQRLLGNDSNDIALLVSSQYAGKVLLKHQGDAAFLLATANRGNRNGMSPDARTAYKPSSTTTSYLYSRIILIQHILTLHDV
jgi:hypothetical protein